MAHPEGGQLTREIPFALPTCRVLVTAISSQPLMGFLLTLWLDGRGTGRVGSDSLTHGFCARHLPPLTAWLRSLGQRGCGKLQECNAEGFSPLPVSWGQGLGFTEILGILGSVGTGDPALTLRS